MMSQRGQWKYSSIHSLLRGWVEMNSQLHTPAALAPPPSQKCRYPLIRRTSVTVQLGFEEKNYTVLTGFQPVRLVPILTAPNFYTAVNSPIYLPFHRFTQCLKSNPVCGINWVSRNTPWKLCNGLMQGQFVPPDISFSDIRQHYKQCLTHPFLRHEYRNFFQTAILYQSGILVGSTFLSSIFTF